MKKNFIYLLAVTLLMGLFASCSQEEALESKAGKSKLVSMVAELPAEFAKTRALPSAAKDHQLRCILEVWTKDVTPVLIYHMEQVGDQVTTDGKLSFEFYLDNGTYDCLMWADFIDKSATPTDGNYADKYYNTTDLKKVTIIDPSKLYNTDACDAFFASQELLKTDEMESFDAILSRPFAKLIVSEKNKANFELCRKVTISHRIPASFNVAEGTASTTETVAAELTDAAPIGAGNTDLSLFSCYAFADEEGALKQITLSFKKEDGTELRNTSIPAGVAFERNHCTKAKGHLVAAVTNNTTVDVGVSDGWDPEINGEVDPVDPTPEAEDPKVGSFYYTDGTWSAVLDETKECVGIIFAVGAGKGDAVANYNSKLSQIKGYVMALKNTSKQNLYAVAALTEPANLLSATDEYVGYTNTSIFQTRSDYSAEENFKVLKALKTDFTDLVQTSGWYIPSGAQMIDIFASTYSTTDNAFKTAFALLIEKGTAKPFEVAHSSNTTGYITSTINSAGSAYRITLDNLTHATTPRFGKASDAGFARPVFTF